MPNPNLVQELLAKKAVYASEAGYWKARGFEDFPGWSKLPFADFFEDLSQTEGTGHKKMWLNPDGSFKTGRLFYSCETLMPLYEGIKLTQQRIVSAGFFIYSALIVNLHMRMAFYSRKYKCEPNVPAILEVADATDKKDLENRAAALRIAAYLIYEGDGLGGYSDPVWKLWGKIFNLPCPDNHEVLSAQEAEEANEEWKEADDEERKQLFYEWWCDINETHAKVPQAIVNHIYVGFKLVNRYQLMESPSCPEHLLFDPTVAFDCQAAICGFFRRSAGGHTESKGHDSNDLTTVPNYLAESLADGEGKVRKLLTGHQGLTPFGNYIIELMELTLRRIDIVSKVVERQNEDHQAIEGMVKKGFAVRLNKRGRVRKSFN